MKEERRCDKCGETKDIGEFYRDKTHKDGRRKTCISCMTQRRRLKKEVGYEKLKEIEDYFDSIGKICYKCGSWKELKFFPKHPRRKNGYGSPCSLCRRVEWDENKDTINKNRRESYIDNKDIILERNRKYFIENKESIYRVSRLYYMNNSKKIKAYIKKWSKENPEKVNETSRKKRARKNNIEIIDLTIEQWEFIKFSYDNRCAYCHKKTKNLTQDHITPILKGGNHTATNIVPACRSCNSKKSTGPVLKSIQPILPLGINNEHKWRQDR